MLNYSFSTVYMAVLASNIMLILITLLFYNSKIMVNIGYKLIALFIGLTALRFLFPFELPFTKTFLLTDYEMASQIITWIRHPFFTVAGLDISIWSIFEIVWLMGFIVMLLKYIRDHAKAHYFILANSLDVTTEEPYVALVNKICDERGKKNSFQVLTVNGINKPMLYGVVSPRILLPEGVELSQEDLYFSLIHEMSHHFHHDLLIKKIIKFITMVYWWNPMCYILTSKVDIILEMRVDDVIVASGEDTVRHYLHSLFEIGERAISAKTKVLTKSVTMSFLSGKDGELTQRYYMMMSAGKKKKYVLNALLFALMIGIYAASHLFILEAFYTTPEVEEESIGQTTDNSYAVLKEDGTYDIYFYGLFIENTDSLEYVPSDIPIYTEKEISHEEQ